MVNLDLVLLMSGWLFGIIMAIVAVMLFLKLKEMKATFAKVKEIVLASIKDKKITDIEKSKLEKTSLWVIPDDVKVEDVAKTVIEFLDQYWNNPHLKRRAEEIHKALSEALKKWDEQE